MQLLNSRKFQLTQLPEQLQDSIQDMVSHIQIESYYSIKHTRYKHSTIPDSVISQFQKLPLQIQQQHLKFLVLCLSLFCALLVFPMSPHP